MSEESFNMGSAPPAPTLVVGRGDDIQNLKQLLTKRKENSSVVSLKVSLVKDVRAKMSLTQDALAERTKLNRRTIMKAEAGEAIRRETASVIADALNKQLDELIAPSGESISLQVLIAMRGLPGVGKTTLAAALAHDLELQEAFDKVLWTSLGQSPNVLSELAAWGRALGANDIGGEKDIDKARWRLAALLRGKRIFLVVDDAWRAEDARAMIVGGPKCAALVTTRITAVADALAPSEADLYPLDVLSEDHAVKLLENLAPGVVANHRDEARELAKDLERLPLALQVAGRLLRDEARNGLGVGELVKELRDAAKLLPQMAPLDMVGMADTTPTVAALLRKSTDVLDDQARTCFAFLGPFAAKPATFDLDALKSVWEGMADAKQMASFLTARGLLEPLGGGRFRMHALLVAHARTILDAFTSGRP